MIWQDWVAVALAVAAAVYLGRNLFSGEDEGGGCKSCPTPPAKKPAEEGKISHERK